MSSSTISSRTRTIDPRSTVTDSFYGGRSNSVASKGKTRDKLAMPNPMIFPVPGVDKPLPEVGWGEDSHVSNGKPESKRDSSAAKAAQSSKRHARSKPHQRVRDADRAMSLSNTPPGTLAKLLVAEESSTRKTRKLLDAALHQLHSTSQRATQAESQKRRMDNEALLENTKLTLDVEEAKKAAAKAQNEVEMYRLRLQQLETEAQQAKQTIQAVEELREDAERSAAKARATARKFKQEMAKMNARTEGRREGYLEGLQRGRLIVGTSYEYIPGDGTAYIEEVGTEGEEEYARQQQRSQGRSRDVSTTGTSYGNQAPLQGRAESRTSNPARRHHTRHERDRDRRRDDDHGVRERDRHRKRENDRRGEHQESNPGHRQERREHKDRHRDQRSYPSPPETPRAAYSRYERRPVQEPPEDIPEGAPVPMPEPRILPPPVPEIPHIPTPPRTAISSHHSDHPNSPPQPSVHTSHHDHPPSQLPPIVNFGSALNAGVPPPNVTVSTAPPGGEPAPPVSTPVPPPQTRSDSQSTASGRYPDAPLPDGVSPVPRISVPLGPGFYSDSSANAPLSAGGVPFAPGLYRDANGGLEQPQAIAQPSPIPPGGVARSSPEIATPSTMTGYSFNVLRNFPSVTAGVVGSDGARPGSRPGSRPGGVFGFERKLSTINESREGTPNGGLGPSLVHSVDQWRRSLSDSPNHLRPPSRSGHGDLRRKQSSTTTGSSSIQIQIESPSPAPSDPHSSDSGHTALDGGHRRYYDDLQPQEPGYLSPHHAPRDLIAPEPDPNEAPVIPGRRNGTVPKSALKNAPRVYEELPRGFVANGHGSTSGYTDFAKLGALGKGVGLGIGTGEPIYSREKVRRYSYEDTSDDSEHDEDEYSDDDDDDDVQWPPAPPGAVTGGMPLGVPLAPGIGPNYHPISGTGLDLMSFPIVARNGSSGRGSGESANGSVVGTPRMYPNNVPVPMHGLPPGFSRPATSASGKSSRRSSRSLKAPGSFDVYANPGQTQSVMKPPIMSMPSATVPHYDSARSMQGGESAITAAAYQMPEPGVPQYSAPGMPTSSITSAVFAIPEASIPHYPSALTAQTGSAVSAMVMPNPNIPQYTSLVAHGQASAITTARIQMPDPGVPHTPSLPTGPASSRITEPAMAMPAPSSTVTIPQISMPSPTSGDGSVTIPTPTVTDYTKRSSSTWPSTMPEPGVNQTGSAVSAMIMPNPNVPQYTSPATRGQASVITAARMQMPDAGVPHAPSLPIGPASSRITEPAMAMPAPSSSITTPHISMPSPGDGSVTMPTPTVTDYTKRSSSTWPSTMKPGTANMPTPSVPQYPQTPSGTSSLTPGIVNMPSPTVPQYPQTPSGTSSLTPGIVNMPSPTVPQYPQTPGSSSITPAAMPEPSSHITAPSMTMPTPTSTITAPKIAMPTPGAEYTPGGSLTHNPLPAPPRMTPSMAAINLNPPSPVIPGAWGGGYTGSAGDPGTPNLSRRTSLHAGTTPSMGVEPLPTATMSKKKKKKEKKKAGTKMPVPTVNGARVSPADSDDNEDFDEATMLNTLANANTNKFSAVPTPIYR
ncbi:hypothetical protein D9758_000901 [Tetrapyrgos nigripes]|uniref:Uncharacterized protein n=1 Tax=Tetrapyrgos nigripes TaxID=182062 RepID=A0A8H5LY13_9AGAR|nr:hypothetical protein D9758_000901 [Tetrapyrgos nigripes]